MALKDGQVFYQKNFGHHTYKKQYTVQDSDVYDLASITKIVATVPTLMHLQEKTCLIKQHFRGLSITSRYF